MENHKILNEYCIPFYADGFAPRILLELIRFNPHIIIASTLSSFFTHLSFVFAKLLRRPFIVFCEDWIRPSDLLGKMTYAIKKMIIKKSDAFVAAGTMTQKYLKKEGAKKVFLGLNSATDYSQIAFDKERMEELKAQYGDKRVILYLSRIVRYKGLDVLLKAYAMLENEHDDYVLLIGGTGPFKQECRRLAEDLQIERCEFLGYVPENDLVHFLRLCDVFILPTRKMEGSRVSVEAWGMVINEAMSLGKPVISTTAVAAAYDLIENGVNGFRVEQGNSEQMAYAIERVLENPQMGEKSKDIIEKANPKKQALAFLSALKWVYAKKWGQKAPS